LWFNQPLKSPAILNGGHYQSTKTVSKYHKVPSGTMQFAGIVSAHSSMTFDKERQGRVGDFPDQDREDMIVYLLDFSSTVSVVVLQGHPACAPR
jgi:hypothetical protein